VTRLQFRIAGILIGATCLVVAVSTIAAFIALSYPNPERMVGPVVAQVRALESFRTMESGPFATLAEEEVAQLGREHVDLSEAISARLKGDGVEVSVRVYDNPARKAMMAVAQIDGESVAIDFPPNMGPPLELWIILGTWLGLIALGVIAVSLVMAYRVTRPFAILEQAIATVGPDGILPHVPEVGSREAIETASVLNRLSERLRTAMESRMRLVAAAGHDFRTPMTRMRLRAEFLNDEDRADWLHDLDELEHIADSAIGLVQEEVSDSPSEPLQLDELLAEEVRHLVASGLPLKLGHLDTVTVPLPPLAIRRAIRNLMINAATHGRAGTAELFVRDDHAVICITDIGPGIPEDLLDRVFEPFFRAEPGRLQTIPGAGLGLAIAAEIVERVGGQLKVRNGANGGLIQEVVLPLLSAVPGPRTGFL
jgi:signal transduction histidine kinase